jgi:hypothetical protein
MPCIVEIRAMILAGRLVVAFRPVGGLVRPSFPRASVVTIFRSGFVSDCGAIHGKIGEGLQPGRRGSRTRRLSQPGFNIGHDESD